MRAFDIIRVVVLTKFLFFTSDVSSTPTKYSTSNPHLLISGDTHDVVRALRTSDESDTQERVFPVNIDPLLKYFSGTEAHTAYQIAGLKNALERSIVKAKVDETFELQLKDNGYRKHFLKVGLALETKPENMQLFLSQHLTSNNDIKKIGNLYTKAYQEFEKSPGTVGDVEKSVETVINDLPGKAEQSKMTIQKDKKND